MAKVIDVSNAFEKLGERIETMWAPHIPLNITFLSQAGWPHLPLTPQDGADLAFEIAERVLSLAGKLEPAHVEAEPIWDALCTQAIEMKFANFGSDINQVAKSTFDFLFYAMAWLPPKKVALDWDSVEDAQLIPKAIAKRLSSLQAKIDQLDPKGDTLQQMVSEIESAHDAAERLPTDLLELQNANRELKELLKSASESEVAIRAISGNSTALGEKITKSAAEAEAIVERVQTAYRITTSAGLAHAFEERSRAMTKTGWGWVTILVAALAAAVFLGQNRLDGFQELLRADHPTSLIVLNLMLAALGVAGPVWVAWLSTKNIGRSFKLAEDYAFKSSVSRAYEGYRKEAVSLDDEFAKRLFNSALSRLDELPSRLVSTNDHSSPLSELLDNPAFKEILSSVPGVTDKVGDMLASAKGSGGAILASFATAAGLTKGKKATPDSDTDSE